MGLSGWANNLDDGRVEILACGEECDLQTLEKWLWQGPRHAEVSAVHSEAADAQPRDHHAAAGPVPRPCAVTVRRRPASVQRGRQA